MRIESTVWTRILKYGWLELYLNLGTISSQLERENPLTDRGKGVANQIVMSNNFAFLSPKQIPLHASCKSHLDASSL